MVPRRERTAYHSPTLALASGSESSVALIRERSMARIPRRKVRASESMGRFSGVLEDDMELFKQFTDNESFRRWLTDTIFGLTYRRSEAG